MCEFEPSSAEELAERLKECAVKGQRITIRGHGTKELMGGPVNEPDVVISTGGLRRILQYEPGDLTVSVEAGMPFEELQSRLRAHGQMVALDPPFFSRSTVGGVIATNVSGPMRRGYGAARDLVIGMSFAMLDGKIVKTGGMVVKNVAGLDMAKLMIGSFGTLAAITSVNFRLHPIPEETRTFLFECGRLENAIERRDAITKSMLQPFAVDLLSPAAAGKRGFVLAARAGGSKRVLERYARELAGAEQVEGWEEEEFWKQVREFTPTFLAHNPEGVVLRVSTTLRDIGSIMRAAPGAAIARAATGVTFLHLDSWEPVPKLWEQGWNAVVEFAPHEIRRKHTLWRVARNGPAANSFAMMKRVKQLFDPGNLLNPSRLYGQI
jgi:glycolate oxidase FAD binding subunit